MSKPGICYLYWIHREFDTDIITDGYIGIAKNPSTRWVQHLKASGRISNKNHKLYSSLRKYNNFKMTILLVSNREYCSEMEYKLRPFRNIGLNHAVGGLTVTDAKSNFSLTDELSKKISDGLKMAYSNDPTIVERQSASKRGRKLSEDHKAKIGKSSKGKGIAWENSNAEYGFWKLSFEMYDKFCNGISTYYSLSKSFGLKPHKTQTIFKMFLDGWNPYLDTNFIKYIKQEN